MQHYYTKDPEGGYSEQKITAVIYGRKMEFLTADGVFFQGLAGLRHRGSFAGAF